MQSFVLLSLHFILNFCHLLLGKTGLYFSCPGLLSLIFRKFPNPKASGQINLGRKTFRGQDRGVAPLVISRGKIEIFSFFYSTSALSTL